MYNGRFATALHILTLLNFRKGEFLSSEYIAGSININPAIVRKETSNLREHGLIVSKEGKGGGNTLAKAAHEIQLSDVYLAVNHSALLGRSKNPNPNCSVGKQINIHLNKLYQEADEALLIKLKQITLEDFTQKFS